MILSVNGLKKSYGERKLFDNVDFKVEKDDIIGLIGDNGCGKTTLFKLLSGEELPDSGGVVRQSGATVGVLNQHACQGSVLSAYDEVMKVFSDLCEREAELERLSGLLTVSADGELIEKHSALREEFERDGGLTFRARAHSALKGLGFSDDEQRLSVASLSGGQRSKVELCKLLLSKPDLILLDEPTNHLDIDAIEWLDGYIKNCKSAVMIISHDRYFLDRVANRIFEISDKKLYSCDGNYSKYCTVRDERKEAVRRNYENTMREVGRIERIIEQQRRWNREKNIKTAESKQKMIDRMLSDLELPESERENMTLSFSAAQRSGDTVIEEKGLSVSFGDRVLYDGIDLSVRRGERIFIIGPNGCGKTTLLKQLLSRKKFGACVSVGVFDQHQRDLDLNNTVFGELREAYPNTGDTALRSALALFLFKGDDVFAKIEELSGGERARVALCKLMLAHNNLLLLDEPTNHLDLESREILEDALADYDGTVLCVSHDRYFINRLATAIVGFSDGTAKRFNGNYDDFIACRSIKEEKSEEKKPSENKQNYLNKKREASEQRKKATLLAKCEKEIAEKEAELDAVNKEISDPETASDYERLSRLTERVSELENDLTVLMDEWERLSE